MTDKEILEKAVEKANKEGNYLPDWAFLSIDFKLLGFNVNESDIIWSKRFEIIFSHDFAIAFWGYQRHKFEGDPPVCRYCNHADIYLSPYCWQTHLQQMVLEKNPIQYLGNFLGTKEVQNKEK